MKKLHKQIISMLLCAVMALSLVACGNNSTPSDTTPVADDGTVSGTLEIQYFVGGYGSAWWEWLGGSYRL